MKYQIFVSGVQKELKDERISIKRFIENDYLLKDHFNVYIFEKDNPSRGKSSEEAYLEGVRKSEIYIGLLGYKYSFSTKGVISPTELEFREACKNNKEILMYIKGENGKNDLTREGGVQKLIKEIQNPKKGYCYKRYNSVEELQSCVYESLVSFLREQGKVGKNEFDECVCESAKLSDIDEKKVNWFIEKAKQSRNLKIDTGLSVTEKLIHLNLICEGKFTNAAILLFGKDPHKTFMQAEVKCIQMKGFEVEKPFDSFRIFSGNLFDQIEDALSFTLGAIKKPLFQQEQTAQAARKYEVPIFAIQEAIVNAVAHRNYNTSSGVQVFIFADRIEITNSGSLPPELSIDDLSIPHQSYPGNPLIANVLFLADYIQKSGTGTMEMIKQCKKNGLPDPYFEIKRNVEFKSVIPRDLLTESSLKQLNLNERQLLAVTLVKEKREISLSDFKVKYPGVNDRTLNRDLQGLVAKKVLKASGHKKGRRYSL